MGSTLYSLYTNHMSLPIDDIITILRDGGHLTDPKALQAAAKDLLAAEREVKESKTTEPRGKTRLIALVRQDKGSSTLGGAYIISAPDTDTPESETYHGEALLNRLRKAAQEHNEAPRGRGKARSKVTTWSDLFRLVKAKTFKQSGSQLSVKAKGNAHELIVLESETIAS